jgi:geranylgeranyl reductase family protein
MTLQAETSFETYDVLVVGLGPAGSAAAYELSKAGYSVLAFEKKSMPRYKPCGGGLSLRIEKILEPDFKEVVEQTIYSVHFTFKGQDDLHVASTRPIAYMVMRDRFDAHLASKAKRAGTHVVEGEAVVEIEDRSDGVEIRTTQRRYRGRYLIGADGANSMVARHLFPERRIYKTVSLESELLLGRMPDLDLRRKVLVDFERIPGGYGWIFPKQDKLSIGIAGFMRKRWDPHQYFQHFTRGQEPLTGLAIPKPTGHPIPLFQGPPPLLSRQRILLAGDAASLVDPFFGEGIYYAVRSGQLAAMTLMNIFRNGHSDLSEYDRLVAAEFYPEFRMASRLAFIVYAFPRVWYWANKRHHEFIELYYDVLRGVMSYRGFVQEVKKALKSIIGWRRL